MTILITKQMRDSFNLSFYCKLNMWANRAVGDRDIESTKETTNFNIEKDGEIMKWVKTKDELPVGVGHVDCYIYINGEVLERPYNCLHGCWDDRDYDDFEFDATDPTHWMYKPEIPLPPTN